MTKIAEDARKLSTRFTPLADKIALVKSWPGINPNEVDAAVALAHEDGTIAGFETESPDNPLLDLVIVIYRNDVPATLRYGRARMREVWNDHYIEWADAYEQGVDDKRVELIPGASAFKPNTIVVQAVDFGANWHPDDGCPFLEDIQMSQAGRLADFATLFNASQSPNWVEQMDGVSVPFTILAALLINAPRSGLSVRSPVIWHDKKYHEMGFGGFNIYDRFHGNSTAVVRDFISSRQ